MTLAHARIIKAAELAEPPSDAPTAIAFDENEAPPALLRRVAAVAREASAQADRILAEANAAAATIIAEARAQATAVAENAAQEAESRAVAQVIAEHVHLRISEERRAERNREHTITLAAILAERIVGEALTLEPARIGRLAESALSEARGARRVRIEACPDDVPELQSILADLGETVPSVEANRDLTRGSLVVHTELGRIDARLGAQLARLVVALP